MGSLLNNRRKPPLGQRNPCEENFALIQRRPFVIIARVHAEHIKSTETKLQTLFFSKLHFLIIHADFHLYAHPLQTIKHIGGVGVELFEFFTLAYIRWAVHRP
jgi:hypothetical protein